MEGQVVVLLELKYCERCGGLWVRMLRSDEIYCASCAIEMADFAPPRKRSMPQRLADNHKSDAVPIRRLTLVCRQGGEA
jgi:hypothetical protein